MLLTLSAARKDHGDVGRLPMYGSVGRRGNSPQKVRCPGELWLEFVVVLYFACGSMRGHVKPVTGQKGVLLSFSKVMSCSGILAFGLTKKGFHQCGQLLNATQCAYHELLHLTLGLH